MTLKKQQIERINSSCTYMYCGTAVKWGEFRNAVQLGHPVLCSPLLCTLENCYRMSAGGSREALDCVLCIPKMILSYPMSVTRRIRQHSVGTRRTNCLLNMFVLSIGNTLLGPGSRTDSSIQQHPRPALLISVISVPWHCGNTSHLLHLPL